MAEASTLAEIIDKLFKTVTRSNGSEHSMEHVAKWCAAWLKERHPTKTFSKEYMRQLRAGIADNPTKGHLEAIAAFFEVDPAIFFDSEKSRQIQADLDLVVALRDADVHSVALRALSLTPAHREQVLELMRTLQANQSGGEGRAAKAE
ncbi:XRE family transcriptional regulator [Amycolatopsis sp. cg9]|uniref:XRE family transcriptional regulator n=1 Tax=Amycolatopsis sp. cg9 TaxID=3238801 RepID=UPI003524CA89